MNTKSADKLKRRATAFSAAHEHAFLSKYGALADLLTRINDIAIVVASAFSFYPLYSGHPIFINQYYSIIVRAILLVMVIFPAYGIYRSRRGESITGEIVRIWSAWTISMLVLLALEWVLQMSEIIPARSWFVTWYITGGLLLTLSRAIARWSLERIRALGLDSRSIVIIGATPAAQNIVSTTRRNPWMGLDVQSYVRTPFDSTRLSGIKCIGDVDDFQTLLEAHLPDQVWIALPMSAESAVQKMLSDAAHIPVTIRFVPDMASYSLLNQHANFIAGLPILTLRGSRMEGRSRIVKSILDKALSVVILVTIAPLMACIALGVKLSSPGPIFFRQKRQGEGGREIEIWKFRSMYVHAESGVVTQAVKGDARVTKFGQFLRRTSMDELPQFINVLQGTMSIVGPRPHAISHNNYYKSLVDGYMLRHCVKPGITGWAQVNGLRGETDTIDKMAARIEYDLHYLQNWSLWLDIKIIALTLIKGFTGKAAY